MSFLMVLDHAAGRWHRQGPVQVSLTPQLMFFHVRLVVVLP